MKKEYELMDTIQEISLDELNRQVRTGYLKPFHMNLF